MKVTPEIALAVECTRFNPDHGASERIRALVLQDVDWGVFLEFAIPHGILPLAARTLRLYAEDLTPHSTLIQLETMLLRSRLRYTRQCQALSAVMLALQQSGIRALAYKGPALVATAYPDPGLREFHDLDIWTSPAETAAAGEVLRSLGYNPSSYQEGEVRRSADKGASQNEFLSFDGQVVIDLLNLKLSPQYFFRPNFEELWERRRTIDLADTLVATTLSIDDLLLALAVHGSKHYWRRLNWSADLAALLTQSHLLNWAAVLERSDRWRCKRRLLCAIVMQMTLYGGTPPSEIAEAIVRYPAVTAAAHQAVRHLLAPPVPGTLCNAASVFSYHYRSTDRAADRVLFTRAELLRRTHRMAARCKQTFIDARIAFTSSLK